MTHGLPPMPHTLLIINPTAGGGRAKAACDVFERADHTDTVVTESKGDAEQIARNAAQTGYERVVAAGGDGTINEVANGLAGSDTAVGILPLGTANVLARELGIPISDVKSAVDIVNQGNIRSIDLGRADSRYFVAMAGLGFDAAVVHRVVPRMKKLVGVGAYGLAVARELARLKPARFLMDIDGEQVETDASVVIISNSASYAYGIKVATDALLDDGLLDVMIFGITEQARLGLLRQALRVLLHTHLADPNILCLKARKISVRAEPDVFVQLDGDESGRTPVAIENVSKALKVIVPSGNHLSE